MTRRPEWSPSPPPPSAAVVEEYRRAIGDLTFNSKPIITNLTIIAQENVAAAPALARVIAEHLLTVHPDTKLPALYLIDSICKNIGEPYIHIFAGLLPQVFPDAFRMLRDEKSRRDFARTLDTWWAVFPADVLHAIQARCFEDRPALGRRPPNPKEPEHLHARAAAPPAYLSPAERFLGQPGEPRKRPPPQTHPHARDHHAPSSYLPAPYVHQPLLVPYPITHLQPLAVLHLLQDLRAAVSVPPERYSEKHVAELMYRLEYACGSTDPLLFQVADERARLTDKRPLIELVDSIVRSSGAPPPQPPLHTRPPAVRSPIHTPREQAFSAPPAAAPIAVPDVSPLLASLSSSLPFNFAGLATVRLQYEEITRYGWWRGVPTARTRPGAHRVLYDDLPRQCTNCGLRFPDTADGRERLEAHLDAHFRRNIRLKDKAKKVLARMWMQREQEWANNVEARESERPAVLFAGGGPDAPAAATPPATLSKVAVGPDHTERSCPVCQERLEVVWDDEGDEWVYRNAARDAEQVHGRHAPHLTPQIVHASCHGK